MLRVSDEVREALDRRAAVVALESTVISHGLPWPENLEVARALESVVRDAGAVPATIGILGGEPVIGLNDAQLERFAQSREVAKISTRELGVAMSRRLDGATTVASTSHLAHLAGIRVFATGGIGGVHRGAVPDVSADLEQLARTPIVCVSAGAKSILDLPATREMLESLNVLLIGWRTNRLPAFYVAGSELETDVTVTEAEEVAAIAKAQWSVGVPGSVLLAVPVPSEHALDAADADRAIAAALAAADSEGVTGKALTPYLLAHLNRETGGATLGANTALLRNNAAVAADVALHLCER